MDLVSSPRTSQLSQFSNSLPSPTTQTTSLAWGQAQQHLNSPVECLGVSLVLFCNTNMSEIPICDAVGEVTEVSRCSVPCALRQWSLKIRDLIWLIFTSAILSDFSLYL